MFGQRDRDGFRAFTRKHQLVIRRLSGKTNGERSCKPLCFAGVYPSKSSDPIFGQRVLWCLLIGGPEKRE